MVLAPVVFVTFFIVIDEFRAVGTDFEIHDRERKFKFFFAAFSRNRVKLRHTSRREKRAFFRAYPRRIEINSRIIGRKSHRNVVCRMESDSFSRTAVARNDINIVVSVAAADKRQFFAVIRPDRHRFKGRSRGQSACKTASNRHDVDISHECKRNLATVRRNRRITKPAEQIPRLFFCLRERRRLDINYFVDRFFLFYFGFNPQKRIDLLT